MVVQKVTQEVIPPGQGLISDPRRELLLGLTSGDITQEMAGSKTDVCFQNCWVVPAIREG